MDDYIRSQSFDPNTLYAQIDDQDDQLDKYHASSNPIPTTDTNQTAKYVPAYKYSYENTTTTAFKPDNQSYYQPNAKNKNLPYTHLTKDPLATDVNATRMRPHTINRDIQRSTFRPATSTRPSSDMFQLDKRRFNPSKIPLPKRDEDLLKWNALHHIKGANGLTVYQQRLFEQEISGNSGKNNTYWHNPPLLEHLFIPIPNIPKGNDGKLAHVCKPMLKLINPDITMSESNSLIKKALREMHGEKLTDYLKQTNTANLKTNILDHNEWLSNAADDMVLRLTLIIANLRCIWDDVQNEGHMRNWKKDPTIIDPQTDKETNLPMEDVILKMNHQATLGDSFCNSLLAFEHLMTKWLVLRDPDTSKNKFTKLLTDIRTDLPFCDHLYEEAKKQRLTPADIPNRDKRKTHLKQFMKQVTNRPLDSALHDLVRKLSQLNTNLKIPKNHQDLYLHITGNNAPKKPPTITPQKRPNTDPNTQAKPPQPASTQP